MRITITIGILVGIACGPTIDDSDSTSDDSTGGECIEADEPCSAHAECCSALCLDVTGEQLCYQPAD